MSWSLCFIGRPKDLVVALKEYGNGPISEQSKKEYDSVKDSIITLVEKNFVSGTNAVNSPTMRVEANGHTYQGGSSCQVKIEFLLGTIVPIPIPEEEVELQDSEEKDKSV